MYYLYIYCTRVYSIVQVCSIVHTIPVNIYTVLYTVQYIIGWDQICVFLRILTVSWVRELHLGEKT